MKKTCAVCDKCEKNWAAVSVSIRSAGANIDLKLIPPGTEEEKGIGPFDLCEGCLKEVFKGVKAPKPETKV
jgi:hypothetical protein